MMQAPAGSLTIADGRVIRTDHSAGASMSLGEIANGLAPTSKTRGTRDPGLSAEGWFHVDQQVYPYGTHAAMVRVDRETGGLTFTGQYTAVGNPSCVVFLDVKKRD